MKSFKVLLPLLAVFSPVLVLSQKVDPLASSSVVRTARTEADDVSPMKNSNDVSKSRQLTGQTTTPLEESIVDKRGLNGVTTAPTTAPLCKKFTKYFAVDDGQTSLRDWCDSLDYPCCSGGQGQECADWSDMSNTTYEVCENSCVGPQACFGVASNAADGSSIRFEEGSCTSSLFGDGFSCFGMASFTEKKVNIRVGENSCTNPSSCDQMAFQATNLEELFIKENSCTNINSCSQMAGEATNLEELIIQENSCTNQFSCTGAAYSAQSLKHLFIENSCTSQDCRECGSFSTFDETLQLTKDCCAQSGNSGTACQMHIAPLCKKFTKYFAVDDGQTSLRDWCDSLDYPCCSGGQGQECADWSDMSNTTYEVCENSCVGPQACFGVASNAADGSSIRFEEGSCTSSLFGDGFSCFGMASFTEKKVNIRVGENSCTNPSSCDQMAFQATNLEELFIKENSCTNINSCSQMAGEATNLEELIIQENSCTNQFSCTGAAYSAQSLKHLFIENSCTSQDCRECGSFSTFDETLQLTKDCCAQSGNSGTACQYIPSDVPSDIPSDVPSDQPTSVPSDVPSDIPSDVPSDIPSDVPSDQPTSVPSDVPSDIPSDVPSDQPTSVPLDVPSDQPTSVPSDVPSDIPSDVPSDIPSDVPSDQPTSVPLDVPSDQPTSVPSDVPSDIPSDVPSDQLPTSVPSDVPSDIPSDVPSDIPSDVPSDQSTSVPSDVPSDIPSDVPKDQPSSVPLDVPSDQPTSVPSDVPSDIPSDVPSNLPSSEPSWLDDEQCKKKDPENDICAELDGRCKIDCEDDEDFVCVPGLCSYDKKWDKPTKSPKMRQLMTNRDVEIIDMEITATGNAERKLKSKATKAPKSSCACRVPRRNKCN